MKINDIFESYLSKSSDTKEKKKLLMEKENYKSYAYVLHSINIPLFVINVFLASFYSEDLPASFFLFFTSATWFCASIMLGLLVQHKEWSFLKYSPYGLMIKCLPKKWKESLNNYYIRGILKQSVLTVEDMKALSTLISEEDFNKFLEECNEPPTYAKMLDNLQNIEKETEKKEKRQLLARSFYQEKEQSENKVEQLEMKF